MRYFLLIFSFFSVLISFFSCGDNSGKSRILIFNKTEFYYHKNTDDAIDAFRKFCKAQNISVEISKDAALFTDENLRKYTAVIFLNTAGDIFDAAQEAAFQRYIHAGGGFAGIHTAIDTEHNWDWYGQMIGAHFESQSDVQNAIIRVEERDHPATRSIDSSLELKDEWFNLKDISPDINILLSVDENSYDGGNMGSFHPVSWYHEFEGGRVFVTSMGHTNELYKTSAFLKHLSGGIKYVLGDNKLPDYSKPFAQAAPAIQSKGSGFIKTSVVCDLFEPMEMKMLPDDKIIFIERRGAIKLYDPEQGNTREVSKLNVFTTGEEGLLGIAIDPNWSENHFIYLFYTPNKDSRSLRLSRFVFLNDSLHKSSEIVMLKVPTFDVEEDYHVAGSLEFDEAGFLYLSIGDNAHHSDGYFMRDDRKGMRHNDGQYTAANSMDLRGKILRIKPLPDGSYLCPAGNLYVNQDIIIPAEPEKNYADTSFQKKIRGRFNESVLRQGESGETELANTVATKENALLAAYKDSVLASFGRPEIFVMGVRNPFRISFDDRRQTLYWGDVGPDAGFEDSLRGPEGFDEVNAARTAGFYGWPYIIGPNLAYRDYDFETRKSGPYFNPKQPINYSPNNTGARYLPPARPSLIWYPFSSSKDFPLLANGARCIMAGPTYYTDKYPANTRFPDRYNEKLIIYDWVRNWIMAVTLDSTGNYRNMEPLAKNVRVSAPMDMLIDKNGSLWVLEYGLQWFSKNPDACLSRIDFVQDESQPIDRDEKQPDEPITWDFFNKNRSFYVPGDKIHYALHFSDPAIESLISLNLGIQYMETNLPVFKFRQHYNRISNKQNKFSTGQQLIDKSDCRSCHALDRKINGPSYLEISARYKDDKTAVGNLTQKILNGGKGNWGDRVMIAHPQMNPKDAKEMVDWVLSVQEKSKNRISREGRYSFAIPDSSTDKEGLFVFNASLADGRGSTVFFRHSLQQVEKADSISRKFLQYKISVDGTQMTLSELKNFDFFAFKEIDLRGIKSVDCSFECSNQKNHTGGGVLEIHLDGVSGPLLGSIVIPVSASSPKEAYKKSNLPIELAKIPADGKLHDIFFVLKRDNAGSKPVLGIDWVKFNLK